MVVALVRVARVAVSEIVIVEVRIACVKNIIDASQ